MYCTKKGDQKNKNKEARENGSAPYFYFFINYKLNES